MLNIPNELQNSANQLLPELNKDVLNKLAVYGWQQVGIMVAIIDSAGGMLMLNHRVSAKCPRNILGPLGETTQQTKQSIEQPAATLLRGFKEELDLTPNHNSMYIPTANGWHINAWPSHKKIAG
ncbi:hypothetical protein KDA11_02070, partial [Candidatus Saccharibacteria bacterium]|nr:hypothetical protein [Candidatus Saccharibacteria bacterium]